MRIDNNNADKPVQGPKQQPVKKEAKKVPIDFKAANKSETKPKGGKTPADEIPDEICKMVIDAWKKAKTKPEGGKTPADEIPDEICKMVIDAWKKAKTKPEEKPPIIAKPYPLPKDEGPKGKSPIIAKPYPLPKGHDFKGLPEDGKELL